MKETDATSSSHEEIQSLLPWYVNKTLGTAEHDAVETHLSECALCLRELELLQQLRAVVKSANERVTYPAETEVDALAAQLAKRKVRTLKEWWSSQPLLFQWALAAQAVALIVLAVISFSLFRRANEAAATARAERQRAEANEALLAQEKQRSQGYQALSASPIGRDGPAIKVTVVFRENATEKSIRELLLQINGARIISGPSSARFYVIGIAAPPDADSKKLMNEAITLLRRSDVVQLAEPLP